MTSLNDFDTRQYVLIILGGMALAFNSGFLNATTLNAKVPVTTSNMTGNSTKLAIAFALTDVKQIALNGLLILSFVCGGIIAGYLTPRATFSKSRGYARVFFVGSALLFAGALTDIFLSQHVYYDFFVAAASGLQNGMASRYSGNILRTTHVTGSFTDVGFLLGKYIRGTKDNFWRIKPLLLLSLGFFLGAVFGQIFYDVLGKYQLLVNSCIFAIVGTIYNSYVYIARKMEAVAHKNQQALDEIECMKEEEDPDYMLPRRTDIADIVESEVFNSEFAAENQSTSRSTTTTFSPFSTMQPTLPTIQPRASSIVQIPLHKRDPLEFNIIMCGAMLLALNAGYINAITYSTDRKIFVSHCTGSLTTAGMEAGHGHIAEMFERLALIVAFTLGSLIVGTMVPSSIFRLGLSYGRVLFLASFTLSIGNILHIFFPENMLFFISAACTCGMQNAMITKYSGGVIRTTHTTGAFTDIGTALGKVLRLNFDYVWQLQVLLPIVSCFISGGILAKIALDVLGKYSLFVSSTFLFIVGFVYLIWLRKKFPQLSLFQLLFGKYEYPFVKKTKAVMKRLSVNMNGAMKSNSKKETQDMNSISSHINDLE